MKHPEDEIQKAICDHLRARGVPGLLWFHVPNGAKLGGKRNAKGFAIQAARLKGLGLLPGVSDLICVHKGRIFALELKAPNGRPTAAQMEFISSLNAAGGFGTIASGLDEALRILETWGLLRGTVQK